MQAVKSSHLYHTTKVNFILLDFFEEHIDHKPFTFYRIIGRDDIVLQYRGTLWMEYSVHFYD